ncbi:MAG TPA: MarR family winged helix-turn-helix transcriptional regulator [Gammaproteobacteria bacterium]
MSHNDSNDIRLDEYIPFRLSILSRAISQSLAKQYSNYFNITIPEWRVLAVLASQQPLAANEMGDRTNLDKVQMSRAINRMLATGLLEKERDVHDKRRILLRVSTNGWDVYRRIVPIALTHQAGLLSVLTIEERSSLLRLITKLHAKAVTF